METVIDLQALMRDLLKAKTHVRLTSALKRVLLYQSCAADLRQAAASLDLLNASADQAGEALLHPVAEQALLMSAIIFYARSTSGAASKGGRGSGQIRDALPSHLRKKHDAIVELRNRAVAHVHVGTTADDWHQQYLALVQHGGGWTTMCTSRGVFYNRPIQASLLLLVPAAVAIMKDRFHKATAQGAAEYNAAAAELPVDKYAMPAEVYFGDERIARELLATRDPSSPRTVYFV